MSEATPDPKQIVRRLIDEVMNQGDLGVLDELYVPRLPRRPAVGWNPS